MEQKYASTHYHDYLQLDKVLGAQDLRSKKLGEPAHDEMLFIVTHQVYELWFKEIIHDLTSVLDIFNKEHVDEKEIGIAVSRLERITVIQKLLIDQIDVIETMTPLDFLDFRNYLLPASGFQSFQFRVVELALGLKHEGRMTYNKTVYSSVFTKEQQEVLQKLEDGNSMVDLLGKWLDRTPFVDQEGFNFLEKYQDAVKKMLEDETAAITGTEYLSEDEKALRLKMLGDSDTYFKTVLDPEEHQKMVDDGKLRLSHKATMSALFISLYRDEPILRMPFSLLTKLTEVDEYFTTWRYRHAQMVLRMLGKKIGTGGSSGYDYLQKTTEQHRIFTDLHNVATLIIPRSELPVLPDSMFKNLSFHYSNNKSKV